MNDTKQITEKMRREWSIDDSLVELKSQLEICLADIGTEKEWQSITVLDDDGPAEVVAVCHRVNARLIAAAPDLLAALERMTDEFLTEIGFAGSRPEVFHACLETARAAIRKAKGEA